MTYSNKKK